MTAPWAGVPLPGGRPMPSGPTLMSHAAASAGEIGGPRRGPSAAEAAPAQASRATAATKTARLPERRVPDAEVSNVNICHFPFCADAPTDNHVAMFHRERGH